jgi:hypothetical protein
VLSVLIYLGCNTTFVLVKTSNIKIFILLNSEVLLCYRSFLLSADIFILFEVILVILRCRCGFSQVACMYLLYRGAKPYKQFLCHRLEYFIQIALRIVGDGVHYWVQATP